MKITKKVLSAILSMVMILSLAMSTFAAPGDADDPYAGGTSFGHADDGSIIIHKLDISALEAAESIIAGEDVYYKGDKATGGALSGTDVVGAIYDSATNTKIRNVLLSELEALSNIPFRIESVTLNANAAAGSTNVNDYTADGTIDSYATTASGLISWTGLANGYYKVTEIDNDTASAVGSSSYIISLPMVDPSNPGQTTNEVHVYPKNRAKDGPEIDKELPSISDINGNVVSWKINADVPADIKAVQGKQSYVITDTMGSGLAYIANSIDVYYNNGGTKVSLAAADYSVNYTAASRQLVVTLTASGFSTLAGAIASGDIDTAPDSYKLHVTYDTVVSLSDAEWEDLINNLDPLTNEVELDFTNSDGTEYNNEGEPVVVDDLAKLKIIKYDGATKEPTDVGQTGTTYLPGAQFKVYTKLASGGTDVDTTSVLKAVDGSDVVLTTNADGSISYNGLGAGTYYLVETQAPTNYKHLTGYVTVTITPQNAQDNDTVIAVVANYLDNGLTLPETGGMGTFLFIAIGGGLICIAGLVLIISKKRNIAK